ncbi:hypothetical protein ACW9G9_17125 [Nocardia asiatica]|uniref:hypothetical protein n=1 Tax=Nocardia asiatica TaxID=209252 RepID=UPI0024538B1B|nr:hypothetical protein [Nocardia asiatica]
MSAAKKKPAHLRVSRSGGDMSWGIPRGEAAWVAAMRAHIWHRRYPPSSVMQALGTPCGHPVPPADMRIFAGLDIVMRVRGWTFLGECSGPEVLTWIYEPSDVGERCLDRGLEPVTTIAATLDRSLPTDTVHDCEVEVLLVGTPYSQARLTGLTGLTPHLTLIEAHRPGDPITLPFPLGRARATDRADQPSIGADR